MLNLLNCSCACASALSIWSCPEFVRRLSFWVFSPCSEGSLSSSLIAKYRLCPSMTRYLPLPL